MKSRLESDLRAATERMLDLTNSNASLTDGLAKQKFDYEQTATRLEDEQAQVANLLKKIKDLQGEKYNFFSYNVINLIFSSYSYVGTRSRFRT